MVSNLIQKQKELKPLSEDESVAVLNAILVGYEHLECLDRIEQTTYYKHEVKQKVKALVSVLERHTMAFEDIIGVDNLALKNIMENKKELMIKIAPLRPELKSGLNQLLDMYFEMPEILLHRLGIKIIDRDL